MQNHCNINAIKRRFIVISQQCSTFTSPLNLAPSTPSADYVSIALLQDTNIHRVKFSHSLPHSCHTPYFQMSVEQNVSSVWQILHQLQVNYSPETYQMSWKKCSLFFSLSIFILFRLTRPFQNQQSGLGECLNRSVISACYCKYSLLSVPYLSVCLSVYMYIYVRMSRGICICLMSVSTALAKSDDFCNMSDFSETLRYFMVLCPVVRCAM